MKTFFKNFAVLFSIVQIALCCNVYATKAKVSVPTYLVYADKLSEDETLRGQLSDRPEFNYFEQEALGSAASLFSYGLDQRYVDVSLNGFSLKDASSPLGVLDLSTLSSLKGAVISSHSRSDFSLESKLTNKNFVSFGLGSLKTFNAHLSLNSCGEGACRKTSISGNRYGGYNQSLNGSEKDFVEDQNFHHYAWNKFGGLKNEYQIVYVHRDGDYDFFGLDDATTTFQVDYMAVGDRLSFKKGRGLFVNFNQSIRHFRKNSQKSYFSRGQNFEAGGEFDGFSLKYLEERASDFKDQGAEAAYNYKDLASLTYTSFKERKEAWALKLTPLSFVEVYYKETLPSLFQIDYQLQNFPAASALKTQKSYGVSLNKSWNLRGAINFETKALYQRAKDQIEWNNSSFSYANFEKVENIFLQMGLDYKVIYIYAQAQRAKALEEDKDLPNRSRWAFGGKLKNRYKKLYYGLGLVWNSHRSDFTGSKIPSFTNLTADINYKNWSLAAYNVLDQDKIIYANTARSPFRIELKYTHLF